MHAAALVQVGCSKGVVLLTWPSVAGTRAIGAQVEDLAGVSVPKPVWADSVATRGKLAPSSCAAQEGMLRVLRSLLKTVMAPASLSDWSSR